MEPETFLRAAVQGKMHVIEKFLADGGSPDTCDEVAFLAACAMPPCPAAVPHRACGRGLGPLGQGWRYNQAGPGKRHPSTNVPPCPPVPPHSPAPLLTGGTHGNPAEAAGQWGHC